jgi:DNA-binding PadR family transcriptional regulator
MTDARSEVVQGTLELLVLKTLSLEPMHGWGISARLRQISGEVFDVNQGSLYPALQRMLRRRWVKAMGEGDLAAERQQPPRALLRAHRCGSKAARDPAR